MILERLFSVSQVGLEAVSFSYKLVLFNNAKFTPSSCVLNLARL